MVSRLCCLQIEPRLKDILEFEGWLKKVSFAVKHEHTCLAPRSGKPPGLRRMRLPFPCAFVMYQLI